MNFDSMFYSLKQGLKNIQRNKIFSIASVGTIVACLFLFGIFYSVILNLNYIVKNIENSVNLTIFFDEELSENQIKNLGKTIEMNEYINRMNFISADEAWEKFAKDYLGDEEELMEIFGDDNPLENSACFEIYLNDISKQDEVVEYLNNVNGVRKINSSNTVANSFSSLNKLVSYSSVAVIIVLVCISIFLISNTVTMGISVRREEINIMKLIGSTDFFVKVPFLVEGVFIGVIGSIIPIVILYILYERIIQYITEKFNVVVSGIIKFLPASEVLPSLIPICLIMGIGIGFIGSSITIKKHLNV